jgi:hypothetical protein
VKTLAGQLLPTPLQLSGSSQTPAAGRQTAVALGIGGTRALDPVQFSGRSQVPAELRQTVAELANASAGQLLLVRRRSR